MPSWPRLGYVDLLRDIRRLQQPIQAGASDGVPHPVDRGVGGWVNDGMGRTELKKLGERSAIWVQRATSVDEVALPRRNSRGALQEIPGRW